MPHHDADASCGVWCALLSIPLIMPFPYNYPFAEGAERPVCCGHQAAQGAPRCAGVAGVFVLQTQPPTHGCLLVCLYIGVDPKSILCEFYRHGQCTKGFKCKFSHDKSVESKGAKIDLFTDQRDVKGEGEDGEDGEGKVGACSACMVS